MKAVSTKPDISVIISSRNRARSLAKSLESIDSGAMKSCNAELVLVDNNSTDDTLSIMQSVQRNASFPVRVLHQPFSSLVRAKNAGVSVTRGDLVVFTDDDCHFGPGYLETVSEVFKSGEFDYCSGQVLLFDPEDSFYGCNTSDEFKLYPARSFLEATNELQGNNLVIRRIVLETVGEFDPMFGPETLYRCEDIDYCARASWAGFTGAFVPTLAVYHRHGRKANSPEIHQFSKRNDYGRGAYYTKSILSGKHAYWLGWLRRIRYQRIDITFRELVGAVRYCLDGSVEPFRRQRKGEQPVFQETECV
jgi:glycosyltransferase involved in cell wall biosynthesis